MFDTISRGSCPTAHGVLVMLSRRSSVRPTEAVVSQLQNNVSRLADEAL